MSNIGPLTTTFTAPSDCSYVSVEIIASPTPTSTFYNYVGKIWPSALRCFPSGYPNAYSDRFSNYYSPGICPSGWTAYPTSDFPDPAETTALCCPPGFITTGENSDVFASSFPCFTTHESTAPATAVVISGSIDIATKSYGDNPSGLITSPNFVMQETGWSVFGMQVRYRSADFLPHNSTSATTTSSSPVQTTSNTAVSSNSQSLTPTPSTAPPPSSESPTSVANASSDNSSLSTGAKIGIGVGVPLGVILLAMTILGFVLIRRRRPCPRQKASLPTEIYETELHETSPGASGRRGRGPFAGKPEAPVLVNPSHEGGDSAQDYSPLPSHHHGISVAPTDVGTSSSIHGTTHSDMASGTVSPQQPDTSQMTPPAGNESSAAAESTAAAEEQYKFRYIDQEPKVKKQRSRGEF